MKKPLLVVPTLVGLAMACMWLSSGCVTLFPDLPKPDQVIGEYRLKTDVGLETLTFKAGGILDHKFESTIHGNQEEVANWEVFWFDLEACIRLRNFTTYINQQGVYDGKTRGELIIRHAEASPGRRLSSLTIGAADGRVFRRQD
jgi:hypothetical protein